jgi:hypothetical protein
VRETQARAAARGQAGGGVAAKHAALGGGIAVKCAIDTLLRKFGIFVAGEQARASVAGDGWTEVYGRDLHVGSRQPQKVPVAPPGRLGPQMQIITEALNV